MDGVTKLAKPDWHDWVFRGLPTYWRIALFTMIVFALYGTSSASSCLTDDVLGNFAVVTSVMAMISVIMVPNRFRIRIENHTVCFLLQHGMPSCVVLFVVFNITNWYGVDEVVMDDELQKQWNKPLPAWNRGLQHNQPLFIVILLLQFLAIFFHRVFLCQMEKCNVISDSEFGQKLSRKPASLRQDFTQSWALDALTSGWLAVVILAMQWAILPWISDSSVDAMLGTTCLTTRGTCALWTTSQLASNEATCMGDTLKHADLTVLKDVCILNLNAKKKAMIEDTGTWFATSIQFTSDTPPSLQHKLSQRFNTTKGEKFREQVKTTWKRKINRQHAWVFWWLILVPTALHWLRLSNSTVPNSGTQTKKKGKSSKEFPVSHMCLFASVVVLAQVGFTMYITTDWPWVTACFLILMLVVVVVYLAAAGYFKGASLKGALQNILMGCAIISFVAFGHRCFFGAGFHFKLGGSD
jgi:hypothetical protein